MADAQAASIGHIDSILKLLEPTHGLAPMVSAALLIARDALCCWNLGHGGTHTVGQESIQRRARVLYTLIQQAQESSPKCLTLECQREAGLTKSWKDTTLVLKASAFMVHNTIDNKLAVVHPLKLPCKATAVHEVNGNPITTFEIRKTATKIERTRFRTETDIQRGTLLQAIDYYSDTRKISLALQSRSVADRLAFLNANVYTPNVPFENQFVCDRLPAGYEHDYRPLPTAHTSDFECSIPVTIGRNKPRIFRFEFTEPRKMHCFRADKDKKTPYFTLERKDVLDVKYVQEQNKNIFKMFIRREEKGKEKKNMKEFHFQTTSHFVTFRNAMEGWMSNSYGFLFRFHEAVTPLILEQKDSGPPAPPANRKQVSSSRDPTPKSTPESPSLAAASLNSQSQSAVNQAAEAPPMSLAPTFEPPTNVPPPPADGPGGLGSPTLGPPSFGPPALGPPSLGPPSLDPAPAQSDWEQIRTESGDVYYFNRVTEESSWTDPNEAAPTPSGGGPNPPWETMAADDGTPYYYNNETGVSVWTLEECI
jgi:hypothetical protein